MSETGERIAAAEYVLDDQIGYLLRLANQRHTSLFQERMTAYGLTPTQFSALIRLSQHGPCSQNHLGRLAAMDVATIKGVVGRLADKGLVTLAPDPGDRRRMLIALSPAGHALIPELHALGLAISDETLAPLGRTERETLLRLLRRLT